MDLISRLSKDEVKELFSKNWMTHDAMWYGICVNALGPETANRMNKKAVRLMAAFEIKRILNLMGKPRDVMIHGFDELAEILGTALHTVLADFMKFDFSFPQKNLLHGQSHICFAHNGLKRTGMLEYYECGIFERIQGWADALNVKHNMKPAFTGCLMHQTGSCEVDILFDLD